MRNIGVVFISKKLTSKAGNEYFSGKLEGAEGFNLMAFIKESKSGTKYLSLVATDDQESEIKGESPTQKTMDLKKDNIKNNTESIIDPDELPF